jgi:hypothetical protein
MSHFIFKVYEAENSKAFRIELYFSAGAIDCNPSMDLGSSRFYYFKFILEIMDFYFFY